MNVRFLSRHQQKIGTGLFAAGCIECGQLAQTQLAGIAGVAVAVEIENQRRVHTHLLQHGFEGRSPIEAFFHSLHGVSIVPVWSESGVAGQRREAVVVREAEHAIKSLTGAAGIEK